MVTSGQYYMGMRVTKQKGFECEGMEWAREIDQDSLFLNIDFDKAYDRIDWSSIFDML